MENDPAPRNHEQYDDSQVTQPASAPSSHSSKSQQKHWIDPTAEYQRYIFDRSILPETVIAAWIVECQGNDNENHAQL